MEYKCLECKKNYASYKSLWNHNSKFHKVEVVENVVKVENNVVNDVVKNVVENIKKNKCKNCNKELSDRISRWRHEKTCDNNITKDDKIDLVLKENLIMKKQIKEIEKNSQKEIEKLKDLLQKSLKIHPKTLTKINKQLNNNNNGIINNNIYVQLGRENLSDILSSKEKIGILNRQAMGLNDLIELVHASGKYKKFMNVYITNLQNTIAYKFDEKANSFIAVNKNELLNDLVDSRVYDIEKFFEEYQTKFDAKKVEQIKKFIERMGNEDDPLKGIKKEEIKLILYNNLEKIKSNETDMIKIDDKEIDV
jgi:hypothetical protein